MSITWGVSGFLLSSLFLISSVSGRRREWEASGEGGLGPNCTRLTDTSYSFFHQTGQNITLTCPKECSNDSTWWYHTHDPNGTLIAVQRGPQLELPFITPPEPSVVGYFCCACADKYPSCCFGVGYSPEVNSFSITDGQEEVETLHVGQSLVMECTVYGYPGTDTRAEIVGPSGFSDNGTVTLSHGFYKSLYVVNIPRVTVSHSGTYTCQGWLTLTQGGETGQERSLDIIQKNLVVYEPPKITRLFEDFAATGDTVTFVCEVECSIEYNVTWLHDDITLNITGDGKYHMFNHIANQHKLMVMLTSPSDVGIYTCVVNTKFRLKETNASIGFTILSAEGARLSTSLTFSVVVLVVFLIIILAVVIRRVRTTTLFVTLWLLEKLTGIVKMVFKTNRKSEDEIPLRQLETGELGSCANVGLDGRSHCRKEEDGPRKLWNKLTSDDLGLVLEEVLDVSSQWYNLGLQLRVRTGTLECIRTKDHDHTDQLRDMLRAWLNTGDDPQWKTLTNALRSRSVGASQLAGDLERKYCLVDGTEVNTREGKITLDFGQQSEADHQMEPPITTVDLSGRHARKCFLSHCSGPTSPTEQPTTITSHPSTPPHTSNNVVLMNGMNVTIHLGPTTSYTVDDQVHYFEKRFGNLINEVCQQVNKRMKPSDFLFCVSNLPVSARNQHRSFIEEKLMNVPPPVNFVKIWSTMNLYWDFLNYGFLEHVINKFGSENLKQQMQEYISELHTFKQRTRLFDFIKTWSCKDLQRQREDCLKKVVVKMEKEWLQCTLQDLESFSEDLVHKFFLPGSDMLFHDAQEGCVCVTWLTSLSIAELLHQNLATVETEFFKKHSIKLITISGQDIYPTLEKRCSGHLRESYTSEQYALGPPTPAETPFKSTRIKEEKQSTDELTRQSTDELTRQCLQKDLE